MPRFRACTDRCNRRSATRAPRRVTAKTREARFPKGRRAYGIVRVRLTEELAWTVEPTPDLLSTQVAVEVTWRTSWPTFVMRYTGQQALERMLANLAGAVRAPLSMAIQKSAVVAKQKSAPLAMKVPVSGLW